MTDAFTSNVDDLSLRILIIRARAQRERGVFIPTLTTLREALRFRKRDPSLLNAARYERALLYEAEGKVALARKDLERIFDHGPGFRDVAQRLSGSPLTPRTSNWTSSFPATPVDVPQPSANSATMLGW